MYYIFMIRAKLCILFRGCPILFEVYHIIKEVKMCGMFFLQEWVSFSRITCPAQSAWLPHAEMWLDAS